MINKESYLELKQELDPKGVNIIAVSKRQPLEKIKELYSLDHLSFGENQAQALAQRFTDFENSKINWHFIGHLQSNKVKYIASKVSLIHSVDSLKLLAEINKQALKSNRIIDCLLQLHIAQEDTKFGLDTEELKILLDSEKFNDFKNVRICGLMGMATYTDDKDQVTNEFRLLSNTFQNIKDSFFRGKDYFKEISMGMSDDYKLAVEEGSTMVRIGTKIFGLRTY